MDSEQGKLFIGGISWDTTEDTLRDYFKRYGEVVDSVIMKDRNTGSARGFGFVVFSDPAVADRVVQEKHIIAGRAVEAKRAVPRGEQQQGGQRSSNGGQAAAPGQIRTKKIFVGGLPANLSEDEFRKYFAQFGNITDVVVMYDNGTQRPRGFGFITFDSEEAVDSVLVKTFHELNDKLVEVKRAVPKEASSSGGRGFGGGFGAGRGPGFNSGGSLGGGAYSGGRMDSRYGGGRGGGGYPGYGPAGYSGGPAGYGGGYAMNGGYGSPGAGGYGVGAYGGVPPAGGYGGLPPAGGYANGPMGAPRSPWGGAGGLSANSPAYGVSAGYARGSLGAGGQSTGGYASAVYPYSDGGYNSGGYNSGGYNSGGYGGGNRGGGYGPGGAGYMGMGGAYADGSGYSDTTWKAGGADSSAAGFGGAPHPDGGPSGDLAGYGGGYGAAGRQSQRGPDTRFRPYPDRAG